MKCRWVYAVVALCVLCASLPPMMRLTPLLAVGFNLRLALLALMLWEFSDTRLTDG